MSEGDEVAVVITGPDGMVLEVRTCRVVRTPQGLVGVAIGDLGPGCSAYLDIPVEEP